MASLLTFASFTVAKLLWKSEDIQLNDIQNGRRRKWENQLIKSRKKAICDLNIFVTEGNLPIHVKSPVTNCIFTLHRAYHKLFLWKETYDPDNKIDMLEDGELYAPNYFNTRGEFNDQMWAKKFVFNKKYPLIHRFSMACLFWLEDECETLWLELKNSYGKIADHFNTSLENDALLISYRILKLEYESNNLQFDDIQSKNLRKLGFETAVKEGYEYSVYNIWWEMPESERLSIMQDDNFFELMRKSIYFPNDYISHFLFSELLEERKQDLIEWTKEEEIYEVWYNKLFARDEIKPTIADVPIEAYPGILLYLSHRILNFELASDQDIFCSMSITMQNAIVFILEDDTDVLEDLAKAKSICALDSIICCFPLKERDNILLKNKYGGGISVINILSEEGDFYSLYNYFSIFLMENDPYNPEDTLRKDASLLLQKFIQSPGFKSWSKKNAYKDKLSVVNLCIHVLQDVLACFDDLCKKICKEVNI